MKDRNDRVVTADWEPTDLAFYVIAAIGICMGLLA